MHLKIPFHHHHHHLSLDKDRWPHVRLPWNNKYNDGDGGNESEEATKRRPTSHHQLKREHFNTSRIYIDINWGRRTFATFLRSLLGPPPPQLSFLTCRCSWNLIGRSVILCPSPWTVHGNHTFNKGDGGRKFSNMGRTTAFRSSPRKYAARRVAFTCCVTIKKQRTLLRCFHEFSSSYLRFV